MKRSPFLFLFPNVRFLAVVLAVLLTLPLAADVVTLRTGVVLTGKIINQSKEIIRLRTDAGEQTIAKSDIVRIIYRDEEAEKKRLEQIKILEEQRQQIEAQKKQQADERAQKAEEARKAAEEKRRADEQRKAATEQKQVTDSRPVRWKAMLYSAVVPGMGQIYEGQRTRGQTVLASFLASAALTYRFHRDYAAYHTNLDSTLNRDFLVTPVGVRASGLPIDTTTGTVLLSHAMNNIDHLKVMRTRFARATIVTGSMMTGLYAWSLWDTYRGSDGTHAVFTATPDGGFLFAVSVAQF